MLVTGGAGFIGSHLVDALIRLGNRVVVLDNLSMGIDNIKHHLESRSLELVVGDLADMSERQLLRILKGVDYIFHYAANPEVRIGEDDPKTHFRDNLVATFNLLEALRKVNGVKGLVFASTSTIYGESENIPTDEEYWEKLPISTYGATKLGCEALVNAYAFTFDTRALILRYANVTGSRARHGVIVDFIRKLKKNPKRLEVLGDGTQEKSYMHISDCVDATLTAINHFFGESSKKSEVFNIGSEDKISVKRIAEIVIDEMGLEGVDIVFTEGVDGGRGWRGDVKLMQLSINKLRSLGWEPKYNSEQTIKIATQELLREL